MVTSAPADTQSTLHPLLLLVNSLVATYPLCCDCQMFMGSAAYPQEGAYSQYVLGHGGAVNGYTLSEETNFHFKVESAYLYGTMDRMAAAFVSPLLSSASINREILAVHSEYSKNLLTEERRQWQVLATQALPDHPMHHFSTGSLKSLNRSDIHSEVVSFHHSHYSANAMRLVVIGRDSLNTLQYQAMRLFARIPNHHLHATLPSTAAAPYIHGVNLPSLTYMQPISPSPTINLYFPLPSQFHDHKHRTAEYVCYLLAHEGPSSLVARWKARGVVHHVNATLTVDLPSMAVLQYQLTLVNGAVTTKEFEDREQHGDLPVLLTELIGSVFAYLSLVSEEDDSGVRWREWRDQLQVSWDWQQKQDPYELAPLLAKKMHSTPDEYVLDPPQHLRYSNDSVQKVLQWLSPDNAMVHVAAAAYPFRYERKESWYNVPYTNMSLPATLLHEWSTRAKSCRSSSSLSSTSSWSVVTLPATNPFIPTDFSLMNEDDMDINHPAVLATNDYYRLYYDQALASHLPVTLFYFTLLSPIVDPFPMHQAYLLLVTALVNDNLSSLLYQAKLVGYQVVVTSSLTGLHVQLSGLTQTFASVLSGVMEELLAVRVDKVRFAAVKASLISSLSSFTQQQVYQQGLYLASLWMEERKCSNEQLVALLESLDADGDFDGFMQRFVDSSYVEMLAYGNVNRAVAARYANIVMSSLDDRRSVDEGEWQKQSRQSHNITLPAHYMLAVPSGDYVIRSTVLDGMSSNNAIVVHYYCGEYANVSSSVMLDMLALLIKQPAFTSLRTQQQLGYIVHTQASTKQNSLRLFTLVIQSSQYSAAQLSERVLEFMHEWGDGLQRMKVDEWERARSVLLIAKKEAMDTMTEAGNDWWQQITSGGQWDRKHREVQEVRDMRHSHMVRWWQEKVADSASRVRMIVEMQGKGKGKGSGAGGQERLARREGEEVLLLEEAERERWKERIPRDESAVVTLYDSEA